MQTRLADKFCHSPLSDQVESILRNCVHCGFCNATCPTYQLLGNELDGPRGRLYQMKLFFEGEPANAEMLTHLDRCLTCQSCETTCPSGVKYGDLLEIGREAIETELPRPFRDRLQRWLVLRFITSGTFFRLVIAASQIIAPLLPASLRESVPLKQIPVERQVTRHSRKVILLSGCVQPALSPNTNRALGNLLNRLNIEIIEPITQQCCGAAALHTSERATAKRQARALIDLWWPHIESGAEAILVSASGCGLMVKNFVRLLDQDEEYGEKARRVGELYRDPVELIDVETAGFTPRKPLKARVAVHTPCSLQHGLGKNGMIERILERCGYCLCAIKEAHLCCGSAGTYSILQPELSARLRQNKQSALIEDQPDVIVTANIGCQLQIARGLGVPVKHWVELVDDALSAADSVDQTGSAA